MTPALHFTQFGRFTIVRKLGRSMSDVYLAHDPAMNRHIVLKIVEQCHDGFTRAIVDAERRGAAIQQQLHAIDARILEIYDIGEQNGSFFLAMEYAEGRSLAEIIRDEGRIEPVRAARFAAEICSQLTSLHSFEAEIDGKKRAVVHGDIKPSNVQIGSDEAVRLLDFGIAKAISATRKLTHHDLGSPAYCSPERLNDAQVDPHADLWAVGVCLYEMIAGLPPYQAQTTRKLENVIQSRRPPRALPADCPAPLRAIIQKLLAADSSRRYATAAAIEADLKAFAAKTATVAEAERENWWHANATIENQQAPPQQDRPSRFADFRTSAWALLKSARGSLLAGVLSGFFVLVPAVRIAAFWNDSAPLRSPRDYAQATTAEIEQDFQLHARLEREYRWLGRFSPARRLGENLRARYASAASQVFASYRNNVGTSLADYDWQKVRGCLDRALRLSPNDADLRGKLALADAYAVIAQSWPPPDAARRKLDEAAQALPQMADPHLALASFYVYRDRNLGRAVAEWHTAERLGFQLGPREWEQEGDAYLARAEASLRQLKASTSQQDQRRWLLMLQRDVSRARGRLEPISGFGRVDRSLEQLDRLEQTAETLQSSRAKRPTQHARRTARARQWP